jgi:hypothetical protein
MSSACLVVGVKWASGWGVACTGGLVDGSGLGLWMGIERLKSAWRVSAEDPGALMIGMGQAVRVVQHDRCGCGGDGGRGICVGGRLAGVRMSCARWGQSSRRAFCGAGQLPGVSVPRASVFFGVLGVG